MPVPSGPMPHTHFLPPTLTFFLLAHKSGVQTHNVSGDRQLLYDQDHYSPNFL